MSNVQVTFDNNQNHARSESSVAVNPHDHLQVVAASKRFNNIHTYDFTLATSYSTDGGHTWHPSADFAMPGFTVMTDPTLAWDDQGAVYLVGLAGTNPPNFDTIGMVVYRSTDGGATWSAPLPIHNSAGDDKQWAAGDTYTGTSPHVGNVYAVWDDNVANGGLAFARTTDHGGTWHGTSGQAAGHPIATGTALPEIDVAENGDVYVVSIAGSVINLQRSTDGGDSFHFTTQPATGITPMGVGTPSSGGWPVLPGGNFRVITDPTVCATGSTVVIAWADYREGAARIYYAHSDDNGNSWTTGPSGQALLTHHISGSLHHFQPQMTKDPYGNVGCVFYEFGPKPQTSLIDVIIARSTDGGHTYDHHTVTDRPWDPTVDAPWAHGDQNVTFIGDYFGVTADHYGFRPVWTDTRTGIQELFTDLVPSRPSYGSHWRDLVGIVAYILYGIINDGGGLEWVGGHLKKVPPWGPPDGWRVASPEQREFILGAVISTLADQMTHGEARKQIQHAARQAAQRAIREE
ncbi:MAG: hypothetical protein QOG34_1748 [Frankiaceae bacterium]|nr:hypothetical protein [Frankiaceae bacterium]